MHQKSIADIQAQRMLLGLMPRSCDQKSSFLNAVKLVQVSHPMSFITFTTMIVGYQMLS